MDEIDLPIPLVKGIISLAPTPVLTRMVTLLMRKMAHRHPRLFKNLARLDPAVLHIEPTDVPHDFVLRFGGGPTTLSVDEFLTEKPTAHIKGKLSVLLDMLEGKTDGDMLFFSRDLVVSGETTVIVGLRNTLDREGLHVMEDALALFGPFSKPAGVAVRLLDSFVRHVKEHVAESHTAMHQQTAKAEARHPEADKLRAELEELKTRFAKFDVQMKQKERAAL